MRKKVLEAIRINYPEATSIIRCTSKFGQQYYFVVDTDYNKTDITKELTEVCRMYALDELVRRINEEELI